MTVGTGKVVHRLREQQSSEREKIAGTATTPEAVTTQTKSHSLTDPKIE